MDTTSTRGQWMTSYSNDKSEVGNDPTVDTTSTRGQWVTSYSNDKSEVGNDPIVGTKRKWVSAYPTSKWGAAKLVNHWVSDLRALFT